MSFALFARISHERIETQIDILLQTRNNLWNYHGSKSIKSKVCELDKNSYIVLQELLGQKSDRAIIAISNLDREIERYTQEKTEIQSKAIEADNLYEILRRKELILAAAELLLLFVLFVYIYALWQFPEFGSWSRGFMILLFFLAAFGGTVLGYGLLCKHCRIPVNIEALDGVGI